MNENETMRDEQSVPQPQEQPVTDGVVSDPTPPPAQASAEPDDGKQVPQPDQAPPKKVYINAPPKKKVKDENLSYGLQPILVKIYREDEIIQEQLAKAFNLNESTITRNLKKLEEKGFIERIAHKRTKIIKVTEKGAKTARKVMDYDEEWDEIIKDTLTDEEFESFRNLLLKICEELV